MNNLTLLDKIFNKIKFTPFLGKEERESLTKSYNSKTSELEKFNIIQQIRFNYCNHKFLMQNIYKDLELLDDSNI